MHPSNFSSVVIEVVHTLHNSNNPLLRIDLTSSLADKDEDPNRHYGLHVLIASKYLHSPYKLNITWLFVISEEVDL